MTCAHLIILLIQVQNDLSELLALLSFLMKDLFKPSTCELLINAFGWEKNKKSKSSNPNLNISQLRSMLAPFVSAFKSCFVQTTL